MVRRQVVRRLVITAVTLALLVVSWETHSYRDRLHEYTHNDQWEARLSLEHVYDSQRIVFFGDSQLGYWPMAESFGSLPIINRGVFGEWAKNANARFDRDVITLSPTAVVILFGTNDLEHQQPPDEIVTNVDRLITRAKEKAIKVVLCGLLPTSGDWLKNHSPDVVVALNRRFQALAIKHGIAFVDFFPSLAAADGTFPKELTRDGLHANRSGYVKMTKQLMPAILPMITL